MATPHSYIEIAFESVKVFSNDGELDESELAFLLGLALRDQVVDEDERRVLGKWMNFTVPGPLPVNLTSSALHPTIPLADETQTIRKTF